MKIFVFYILLVGANADPCTDLCARDGPTVCTNGSWTKSNGECHGYLHKDDGICYHTKESASECPKEGKSLKAEEAEKILAFRKGEFPKIDIEGDGITMRTNRVSFFFAPEIDADRVYRAVTMWLSAEPNGIVRSFMSVRKVMQLPNHLVEKGLVSRSRRLGDNYFSVECMDDEEYPIGVYSFTTGEDPELLVMPENWDDIVCSAVRVFSQQIETRVALCDWIL
jgi:hypothetical protein